MMMRPSISGSATFMAMSRASRPRVPRRQAPSSPPAKITCSTGQSDPSSTPGRCVSPGAETAKPVAFSTMSGGASASTPARIAADCGSLRLDAKSGSGLRPRACSASISASTGAVFAACTRAR